MTTATTLVNCGGHGKAGFDIECKACGRALRKEQRLMDKSIRGATARLRQWERGTINRSNKQVDTPVPDAEVFGKPKRKENPMATKKKAEPTPEKKRASRRVPGEHQWVIRVKLDGKTSEVTALSQRKTKRIIAEAKEAGATVTVKASSKEDLAAISAKAAEAKPVTPKAPRARSAKPKKDNRIGSFEPVKVK